jgi:hypothetical protein
MVELKSLSTAAADAPAFIAPPDMNAYVSRNRCTTRDNRVVHLLKEFDGPSHLREALLLTQNSMLDTQQDFCSSGATGAFHSNHPVSEDEKPSSTQWANVFSSLDPRRKGKPQSNWYRDLPLGRIAEDEPIWRIHLSSNPSNYRNLHHPDS